MNEDPVIPPPRLRMRIRLKVLLLLIIVATVSSVVISRTLISFFNEDKATYIQDLNADIASNTAASVELLLRLYRERLAGMGEAFNDSADPGTALKQMFDKDEDLLYLAIYDPERRNALSLCREGVVESSGVDLARFRAERDRMEADPAYLQVQSMSAANSTASPELPTFAVTLPFYAAAYGKTFFLRGDYQAKHLQRAIERSPGFTTYVVDKTGQVFVHSDATLMAARQSFAERKVVQAFLQNLGGSAAGTGEFEEPGGAVLASYASVRNAGLGVLVERPKRDAYLAASRLTRRSMRAAGLIIAITALISLLISRMVTAPLLALSRAAGRLEKGDFAVQVHIGSGDELGDLARSFNLAAAGLCERDRRLKETYEQLLQSEKLAGFGKFSAGIAHEIKNPLTGIIGFAQLLARKLPESDPKLRPLQMIEKEAKRCKTILDNLLRFTRKEGFQFEPVRLHAHIKETLELLAPQLSINGVEAAAALEAPDDLLKGDPNQLRQVFMNLVLNSVDAMEGAQRKAVRIRTQASEEKGYLDVLISDTGSGIPADKIRKIFDPFFTTKEPGKGTGLGLSVSHGIVTNHGGRISVKSQPGEGTEFRITLPMASAEVRAEERSRAARKAEAPPPGGYPTPSPEPEVGAAASV